jgi:CRISPR-associated protein Cas6
MHIVDLEFSITGKCIPADHGYALYGALSRVLPMLHPQSESGEVSETEGLLRSFGIHPINGRLCDKRKLALSGASRLRLRVPADCIAEIIMLSGKTLHLEGETIAIGIPSVRVLRPLPSLRSRLVTIKGYLEPEGFLNAVQARLQTMNIQGEAMLIPRARQVSAEGGSMDLGERCRFIRRTLRVSDKEIVGYALRVKNLSAEESLDLQEKGIGGRRRMGCGIFVPERN